MTISIEFFVLIIFTVVFAVASLYFGFRLLVDLIVWAMGHGDD